MSLQQLLHERTQVWWFAFFSKPTAAGEVPGVECLFPSPELGGAYVLALPAPPSTNNDLDIKLAPYAAQKAQIASLNHAC